MQTLLFYSIIYSVPLTYEIPRDIGICLPSNSCVETPSIVLIALANSVYITLAEHKPVGLCTSSFSFQNQITAHNWQNLIEKVDSFHTPAIKFI